MTQGLSYLVRAGLAAAALAFVGATAMPHPALAFAEPEKKCEKGMKWDEKKNKCVADKAELSPDQQLYDTGRALALAGRYEDALKTFAKIEDQNDAKVLTMIGYSKRRMGDVYGGMDFYAKALAIEPDNLYTHEYLGEGYVQIGDIDSARVQLAKLETLCGTACEQYEGLARAIAGEAEQWN